MVSHELEDPSPLAKLGVRQNQKEKVTYATNKELIRKDKQKDASEANSAWEVAKLAVFKQPA